MKKISALLAVIILLAGSIAAATGCQPETEIDPEPTSVTSPGLLPESGLPFEAGISAARERNLPGEDINYGTGIMNLSPGVITIAPFPPAMWIKPAGEAEPVYSCPAGNRTRDIDANDPASWYRTKGFWNQQDNNGNQVTPGWYEIGYEYVITERDTGESYTATPTATFQIVDPDSAMTKNLKVNESVTAAGITVTLERIELNAVEAKIYTFTTPPGYRLTEGHPPHELEAMMNSQAAYSVDGGTPEQLKRPGGKADEAGITLTWDEIAPVPADAKELTFRITRLGDQAGLWEFTIPLDAESDDDNEISVAKLVSQANAYEGKTVTLEAFYFYGPSENALAGWVSIEDGKIVPIGEIVGLKGYFPQELRNLMYTQAGGHWGSSYFGRLRVTGKLVFEEREGLYYIETTAVEVLPWTPPRTGSVTPVGSLQIKVSDFGDRPELQDVRITSVSQPDEQLKLAGTTGADGTITFNDIKQGYYALTFNRDGYQPMTMKVMVTGGRNTSVAYAMAREGEAADDLLPAPSLGPQYRANMTAVRSDGTDVVNPWPSIRGTEITLGTAPDTAQINYRDYIETEAGQTRNNMVIVSVPGTEPGYGDSDPINVAISSEGLPDGITAVQTLNYNGPATYWCKTALQIEISPQVTPGKYTFAINVAIDGKDYGAVPCTIKVIEKSLQGENYEN